MVALLTKVKLLDEILVTLARGTLEVIEEAAALGDQLKEAVAGMVVFDVGLEMLGQVSDARSDKRDLDIGAASIASMQLERREIGGCSCVCHKFESLRL